jgi:transcriptional regulator with XRE-family HTH domain
MITEEKYRERSRMACRYLYDLAKEKGITHDKIAEKTGFTESNVSRMLSGKYSPTFENFLKLSEAVGCSIKLVGNLEDADLIGRMIHPSKTLTIEF